MSDNLVDHYITFDHEGKIYIDIPEATIKLTNAAYKKIKENQIEYMYELGDVFSSLTNNLLGLTSEFSGKDFLHGSLFNSRVQTIPAKYPNLISSNWNSLEEIKQALPSIPDANETTRMIDAMVCFFLSRTKPIWTIYELTLDACTMIVHAKLDQALLNQYIPIVKKGMYVRTKGNKAYLYGSVSEILLVDDDCIIGSKLGAHGVAIGYGQDAEYEFCAKLLALMDAEKTPVNIIDADIIKARQKGIVMRSGVNRRIVSLNKKYQSKTASKGGVFDKTGKIRTIVSVSGYIRQQAYGEGRKFRKTIWVDGFERGQWVKEGLTIVSIKS